MENNVVYCRNCGTQINANDVFCYNCGASQAVTEEPKIQPAHEVQQPAYQVAQSEMVYEQQTPPQASVKSKVFGGIGFGLSMFGFVFSLSCFLMSVGAVGADYYDAIEYSSMSIAYSIIFIATSIIGLIFSGIARNDGNTSGLTATGKVFGIIGIISFALAFIIAIGAVA